MLSIVGMEPDAAADAIRLRLGDAAAAELATDMRQIMNRAHSPIWRMVFEDSGGDIEYADTICTYLALALSNFAGYSTKFTRWQHQKELTASTFDGHWFSMRWDFAEVNPFSDRGGSFLSRVDYLATVIETLPPDVLAGKAHQAHAAEIADILETLTNG